MEGPILTPYGCEPVTVECSECCSDVCYIIHQYCNVLIIYSLLYNKLYLFNIIDSEQLIQNPYEGQVTIQYAETGSLSDGIVKVFYKGKWSGICYDDSFPPNAADSVCRQRGYTSHLSIEEKGE